MRLTKGGLKGLIYSFGVARHSFRQADLCILIQNYKHKLALLKYFIQCQNP